jgi:hypothetical protein
MLAHVNEYDVILLGVTLPKKTALPARGPAPPPKHSSWLTEGIDC